MKRYRLLLALATMVTLFSASGATCIPRVEPPLPRILPPSPSLGQIIEAVNGNSAHVQTLVSNRAVLSGQGFPTLRASVAFERPRRFRLRASTTLTGPELDLGSNDDLFWFWLRRNQPPTLFYCRHDQFASCPVRPELGIDPQWLIQALGVVEFDPALPHQGPFVLPGDRVEICTLRETPQGPETKVTVVDAIHAIVLQQRIYDARGQLLAASEASAHRRDPRTGLILPTVVSVQSPPARVAMRLDLNDLEINSPTSDLAERWVMPNYAGSAVVNLCDPRGMAPRTAPPPGPPGAAMTPAPAGYGPLPGPIQYQSPPPAWEQR